MDVVRDSAGIRFTVMRCDGRSDPTDFYLLEVVELVAPDRVREKCAVTRELSSTGTLPPSWRMAEPVSGFAIEGCDPLPAGTYLVSARGAGRIGSRIFRVEHNGQVQGLSGACE